ncbi:MAG: type II secretion system protein [Deltaproteobacteria bacterium]|nr:type II secretion system protein [Deltaproteobacteria bacterium]
MLNKKQPKGFTLLELIIAISMLSVGLLAVSTMVTMVINSNKMTRNLTTAVNLAQNKIDDLKITSYANIVDSTESSLDENGVSGSGIFDRTVSVVENTNPDYKTVQVTVSWAEPNTRQVVLTTIIAE